MQEAPQKDTEECQACRQSLARKRKNRHHDSKNDWWLQSLDGWSRLKWPTHKLLPPRCPMSPQLGANVHPVALNYEIKCVHCAQVPFQEKSLSHKDFTIEMVTCLMNKALGEDGTIQLLTPSQLCISSLIKTPPPSYFRTKQLMMKRELDMKQTKKDE